MSAVLQVTLHERLIDKAVEAYKKDKLEGFDEVILLETKFNKDYEEYMFHTEASNQISQDVPERPNIMMSHLHLYEPVRKASYGEEEWLQEVKECEDKTLQAINGDWGSWRTTDLKKRHKVMVEDAFKDYKQGNINTHSGDRILEALENKIHRDYAKHYKQTVKLLLEAEAKSDLPSPRKRRKLETPTKIIRIKEESDEDIDTQQEFPL